MKIRLCVKDWIKSKTGESVYEKEEGFDLVFTDFHHGSLFDSEIMLDEEQVEVLEEAMDRGYRLVVTIEENKDGNEDWKRGNSNVQ
jgi:hypothetical protein